MSSIQHLRTVFQQLKHLLWFFPRSSLSATVLDIYKEHTGYSVRALRASI